MTREEARSCLQAIKFMLDIEQYSDEVEQALNMAIEALKAQDRPIICPRCGRTFAESEGRE